MKEIHIEKADGTLVSLNSKKPLRAVKSAVMKDELMGEDTVTLAVESAEPIEFTVGDKLRILGKTYFLNSPPKVQRTGRRYLIYTVVWESAKYDLSKVVMVNEFAGGKETVNETEFDYTGEFAHLMDLLVSNMCRVYGKESWTWKAVNTGVDSAFKPDYEQCETLSFSSENVLSALNTVCQQWNAEFRISMENGANVIEVGRIGRNVYEYVFAYGRGNGLYTLTRDRNADTTLATRLYAYGASSNLGTKYRDGRRRLALPEKHVSSLVRDGLYVQEDALVERFGLNEGAVVFDEIFPTRRGTVTSVDDTDELKFTDQDMFDLNEKDEKGDSKYILGSATPTVRFNTGNLGGYEFSLAGYNSLTKTFTLVPFTDENAYRYPSKDDKAFRIGMGDTYVLLNIALPDSYVADAEGKLAERALEKYGQLYKKLYSYALEMDPVFVKEHFPNAGYAPAFRAGDYVNIKDGDLIDVASEGLGEHTVAVKISSVSVDLYNPFGYTLGLSDSAPSSVVTQIVKSEKDTQKIIKINDLSDPARARRNLRTTAELLEMTFDTDGYFVDGRLRPETVETKMIAVGALSQQFLLDGVVFTPDLNGDVSAVGFSEGALTHLGLDRTENKVWSLLPGQVSGLKDDTAYHIYARCQKRGEAGTMVVTPEALRYDADADFYHFSVGVLSSAREGFRRISLTYGSSTINGREITTGRISAAAGKAYFDLDKGEIGGRIVFSSDAVFRDDKGVEGTLITDGKINAGLIDADQVVAGAASIANFKIQGNLLQGVDSHIVFQNEDIESLADLISPKSGQAINVSGGASASGIFTNTTVTDTVYSTAMAFQDLTVEYPGILKFSLAAGRSDTLSPVEGGEAYFAPVDGEPNEYKCEVLRKTGKGTYEPIDTFRPSGNGTIASPSYFDRNIYIAAAGDYRIRFVWESTSRIYWIEQPEDWPGDVFPILTTELSAAIAGQSPVDRGHIYFAGSSVLTKIGTDGLYSFWSLYNYLYFSQSEGLKIKAGTTLSSPNGEYSLTVNDNGISISGPTGTNASNNTVDFTVAGTRVNIATGEKLSVAFGKIARFLSDLKAIAFSGNYNDLSNKPSIPAKVSQLSNDIGFITKSVSDLANYYLKSQAYTRDEVQALIAAVKTASFQVVSALPSTGQDNIIYLIPKQGAAPDTHDEYIWVENTWELIGNTKVDISSKLDKTGDASDTTVSFVQGSGELESGVKQKTLWGRVAKKIADIISGVITVGKSNIANNLRSDNNFYLGYDGADGIDNPYVILGATATDNYNESVIKRIRPANLTVGRAVNDENGNNIPKTYAKKDEITAVKVGGRNYITGLRDNWEGGIVSSDGTITTGNNYNQVTKDYQDIAFLAGKTAIASVNPDDVITGSERLKLSFRIAFYTLDYLFISYESSDYNMAYKTLTVPDNAAYCKVSVGVGVYGYVSGNFDKVRFQLELGNKETDYSPAPQDIPHINGEYPGMTVGSATTAINAANADTVDNLHAAAAGTVENGKLASYDVAGRLKGTVVEALKYLKTSIGPDSGLSFGQEINTTTHAPNYGMIAANATDIGLQKYGDVTSDFSLIFTMGGYNDDTHKHRGWVFLNPLNNTYAASLSQRGYAKFAGEVTATAFKGTAEKATGDGSGLNIQNNYLKRTYNRPGATWSGVGWRRIYIAGNADNPGGTVLLNIATLYWNTPSQLLSLLISVGPRDVILQQLNGCYNYPISKVRICRKSNTAWCVDVYCNDTRNNSIYANQCGGDGYTVDTEMLNPSVDGYTVNEFDIKAGDRAAQKSEVDACLGKNFNYGVVDPDTIKTNGGLFTAIHLPAGWSWAHVYTMKCGGVGVMQIAVQIHGIREIAVRSTISEQSTEWTDWMVMAKKSDLPNVTYSATAPANPKNGDIWIIPTD